MSTIRGALALLAVLTAAVALAACGSDDGGERATAATAPAERDAFPVTLRHKYGTTTIDAEPQRVVTVGYTEQDVVLALGVKPVATRAFLGGYDYKQRPWAQRALGGTTLPEVGTEQIDFEAVAAQRPDLIIGINSGMTKADYNRLSKIAPTLAQPADYIDFGMPWEAQTTFIGKALGRTERARQVVDDLKARFAAVRREHPEFARSTAILGYGGPDGYGAYATGDTRSRFFTDLGFRIPERVDQLAGKAFYAQFSQEQFRLLDQDLLVMYGSERQVKANPVFGRLKAVKQDRVVYMDLGDQFAGALGFASPLSFRWLLDHQIAPLAAAVDGDPATRVVQPR